MLTLVNTNRMQPPIAPLGLDYLAGSVRRAGYGVEVLDLCMVDDPNAAVADHFTRRDTRLVGLSFRNVDDCFWPSGQSFLPDLVRLVETIRRATDAPIVLGGVGYSIFARQIVEHTGADFGIHGDGETALVRLLEELDGQKRWDRVPGLVCRRNGALTANPPAWPRELDVPVERNTVDNSAYFQRGGQIGLETKRGCPRQCAYCADPLAKGHTSRVRDPRAIADEVQSLLDQGVDVLHLCDAEFNLPREHALAVCDELIRRRLGQRVRWYAYLTVLPFDAELARQMARAGCVGINFTSDAAAPAMLAAYRQPHRRDDLDRVVQLCRENRIAVMLDMLLGGPGETPQTVRETVEAFEQIDPDCAGAALGVRLYPETPMIDMVAAEGPMDGNTAIHRHYEGPVDLLQPTFYIASALGDRPAALIRELIDGDPRFFEPEDDTTDAAGNHNYNANQALADAIASGARGAYWDILRQMRQ